jgi:hypothetical protein
MNNVLQGVILGLVIFNAFLCIYILVKFNALNKKDEVKKLQESASGNTASSFNASSDTEIAAVISAAVYMMLQKENKSGLGFRVRSIKRLY